MSFSKRRKTVLVDVGGVKVGSERPIVVQSMTNTDTADIPGTVAQVNARGGQRAGPGHRQQRRRGEGRARDRQAVQAPVIGDFHYNGVLLTKYPTAPGPREIPDQPGQCRRQAPR
jgi:(E)-4-hydroxy-3-methylbut-2-enyl-diphosphate synthase